MGSKGGGGGYDPSAMIEYGQKALDLQKDVYEDTVARSEPWYDTGVSAVGRLSDMLGLPGGSVRSRESIYNQLLPQYTTQQRAGGDSDMWKGYGGALYGDERRARESFIDPDTGTFRTYVSRDVDGRGQKTYQIHDVERYQGGPLSDVVDYDALNAAVDQRLAEQQTPEGYGSLLDPFSRDKFEEDPGYQFRKEEGNKALERLMAARGQSFTPAAMKALADYNQGLASQEYGTAYDRYNIDQGNIFNRLAAASGMGQTSNQTIAGAGQNYAASGGDLYSQMGNAITAANVARASRPSMFNQLLGTVAPIAAATYGGPGWTFSDARLKENIKLVDVQNRHNIYEFDLKDGSGRYRGVLAHEVQKEEPDAVREMPNGFLAVDYDKIGVELREVK